AGDVALALELRPVAGDLEEGGDLLGRLRTDPEPVQRTLGLDLDEGGVLGGVVLADLLEHGAIALLARIGHDDAVERCTDLAHALQADLDSHVGGLSFRDVRVSPAAACGVMRALTVLGVSRADGWRAGPRTYSIRVCQAMRSAHHPGTCAPGHTAAGPAPSTCRDARRSLTPRSDRPAPRGPARAGHGGRCAGPGARPADPPGHRPRGRALPGIGGAPRSPRRGSRRGRARPARTRRARRG